MSLCHEMVAKLNSTNEQTYKQDFFYQSSYISASLSSPQIPMELDKWNMDILNELIKYRDIERDNFDFKSTAMGDLAIHVCAMANTITGMLCLGVDDPVYAPSQKVLMLVDVVFPGWVPYPYLAVTTDVGGFTRAHDIALNNYNFDTFIGGHLTRIGTRNDVMIQKQFISDLEKAAAKANHDITFGSIAKQVGHFENPWFIFKRYNDAVDGQCARDMLAKWENKLGGAQEFMETHCYTMGEALRIVPDVVLTQGTFAYK